MGKKKEGGSLPPPPGPEPWAAAQQLSRLLRDETGRGPPAVALLGGDHQSSKTKLVGDVDLHIAWERQREGISRAGRPGSLCICSRRLLRGAGG